MAQKRPEPTQKQRLIIMYMKKEGMDPVQAAHAADRFIELTQGNK